MITLPIWMLTEIHFRITNRWRKQGRWKPIKKKVSHGTYTEVRPTSEDIEYYTIWFGTRIGFPYHGRYGVRNTISFDITIANFGFILELIFPVPCFPLGWYGYTTEGIGTVPKRGLWYPDIKDNENNVFTVEKLQELAKWAKEHDMLAVQFPTNPTILTGIPTEDYMMNAGYIKRIKKKLNKKR